MAASRTRASSGTAARRGARKPDGAARLRALAERCRSVAEQTAVPDIAKELAQIARALDDEAARAADR